MKASINDLVYFLNGYPLYLIWFATAVLIIVTYIVDIISYWGIFKKAQKPGWISLIPIYRVVILLEITGKPLWWIIILLWAPLVNIYFYIKVLHKLSLSFGKNSWFTVGLALLPFIFKPILAFGKATYATPLNAGQAQSI
jgi:hypothetical protein